MPVELRVDGDDVIVEDERATLLDALRAHGVSSVKDGCAPQGQCGCCTVLVDGHARVSCVTPVRRVAGRSITTLDGLSEAERRAWADAFVATGGSQCGFCTPGIICRFSALRGAAVEPDDPKVATALAAHLCRCTGWQTIVEAYRAFGGARQVDCEAASRRATIEGRTPQAVGPDEALGGAGFSADTVPTGALFGVPDGAGGWILAESLPDARRRSGRVQGRRTTAAATHPLDVPGGDWDLTLRTGWVEPAPLETETVWCEPGGAPSSLLVNGGAFGAKTGTALPEEAQRLADEVGRPVALVLSREDSVRTGPKRPPIAAGLRRDGSGEMVVVRTPGIVERLRAVLPDVRVTEVEVDGPPTSTAIRGAGWAEATVLRCALLDESTVPGPDGGLADATFDGATIRVRVDAGAPLDETVLRSYCIGAAHMAYSWVTSESLVVDADGAIHDLTVRSFGIVRAVDMPHVDVEIAPSIADAVNGSDAVFAAVAAAVWRQRGFAAAWPTG